MCLSQHVDYAVIAHNGYEPENFFIAAITRKYVCYNSAYKSMNESRFMSPINLVE